jgi:chromosome segregation ATPase
MSSSDDRYEFRWFGNNRYLCDVLEDMRRCIKSLNFSPLKGLVEEAQAMAGRMEAALGDQKDLLRLQDELSKARREYRKLEREYNDLYEKVKKIRKSTEPEEDKK